MSSLCFASLSEDDDEDEEGLQGLIPDPSLAFASNKSVPCDLRRHIGGFLAPSWQAEQAARCSFKKGQ
jgi:hypothetical protein